MSLPFTVRVMVSGDSGSLTVDFSLTDKVKSARISLKSSGSITKFVDESLKSVDSFGVVAHLFADGNIMVGCVC